MSAQDIRVWYLDEEGNSQEAEPVGRHYPDKIARDGCVVWHPTEGEQGRVRFIPPHRIIFVEYSL